MNNDQLEALAAEHWDRALRLAEEIRRPGWTDCEKDTAAAANHFAVAAALRARKGDEA